jgi:hypothetical protein
VPSPAVPWLALFLLVVPALFSQTPAVIPFSPEAAEAFKRAQGFIQRQPLKIGALEGAPPQVTQGQKWELGFALEATFSNPFDPDEVRVDLQLVTPKGQALVVPGFFSTPCALTAEGRALPSGAPSWKVRFTPSEAGLYRYRLSAKDRSGTITGPAGNFECVAGRTDGLVRVSRKVPTAFEYASGKAFFPIGWNLLPTWSPPDRVAVGRLTELLANLDSLAAAGGNCVRLRADSYYLAIEGISVEKNGFLGPGWYHQPTCWETDEVYRRAESLGIQVMHCLMEGNTLTSGGFSPGLRRLHYELQENGGPCATPADFWSNAEMQRLVHQRVRYVVARWGYSPNLMCWEIFNEINTHDSAGKESETIIAYHKTLAHYLRTLDPSPRLISSSTHLRGAVKEQALWALPEMDFSQIHLYDYVDPPTEYPALAREFQAAFGKPIFFGEYGMSGANGKLADALGVHIHNALFSSALGAGAGVANWYVGELLRQGHTRWIARFSRWSADIPMTDPGLRDLEIKDLQPIPAEGPANYRTMLITPRASEPFRKMEKERFAVDPVTRQVRDADCLQKFLHCKAERKSRPTFLLDCGQEAEFVVEVNRSVGDESNALVLYLDGVEVKRQPFPAGKKFGANQTFTAQWQQWTVDYRDEVRLTVPAGKHEVMAEALGKDRLELSYRIERYSAAPDPVAILGRTTGKKAWLWIRNQVNTDLNERLGITPERLGGASASLVGLEDGNYRLDYEDPWSERALPAVTATCAQGRLSLQTPAFQRSLLCKVTSVY